MRRTVSLLLTLLAIAAPRARAQDTGASPGAADRVVARLGATLSPETRRYFGLFPDVAGEASVGVAQTGDGLRLTLRRTAVPDSLVTLSPELSDALGAVVDAYEMFFWDERDEGRVTPALSRSLRQLRDTQLLVPSTLKREVALVHTLTLDDGRVVRGRVLAASDVGVTLWTAGGPYRWDAPEGLAVIPLNEVRRIDVLGSRLLAPLVTAGLHAAALTAATLKSRAGRTTGQVAMGVGTGYRILQSLGGQRGVDRLASLERVAFFRRGAPPEFERTTAAARLALASTPARPAVFVPRWRASDIRLSASVARTAEASPRTSFTTVFRGTGAIANTVVPLFIEGTSYYESATWKAEAELDVPLPSLPLGVVVGGSTTRFGTAPTKAGTATVPASDFEETISDREVQSYVAGFRVGTTRGPLRGNRLVVAAGMRRESAVVTGAVFTYEVRSFPVPSDSSRVTTYREVASHNGPIVRASYTYDITRVASLFVHTEWGADWEHVVASRLREIRSSVENPPAPPFVYGYLTIRPSHAIRFTSNSVTTGLRLHL